MQTPSNRVRPRISSTEIAARAYTIWEREGRPGGRALQHWLKAEAELLRERRLSGSLNDFKRPDPAPLMRIRMPSSTRRTSTQPVK